MRNRILKVEIVKWLSKLKRELKETKPNDKRGKEFLENINAYVYDCEHWLKEGDYVKAWEVISFAWGLFEAAKEFKVLK